MEAGDAEAGSDLLGSIASEKIVFDREGVRTPFGSAAKALFGPESHKTKDAEPQKNSASCQVIPGGRWFEPSAKRILDRVAQITRRYEGSRRPAGYGESHRQPSRMTASHRCLSPAEFL